MGTLHPTLQTVSSVQTMKIMFLISFWIKSHWLRATNKWTFRIHCCLSRWMGLGCLNRTNLCRGLRETSLLVRRQWRVQRHRFVPDRFIARLLCSLYRISLSLNRECSRKKKKKHSCELSRNIDYSYRTEPSNIMTKSQRDSRKTWSLISLIENSSSQ